MTLFEVIRMIAKKHGYTEADTWEDGWLEDIADKIIEDNGDDLSVDEAIELVDQFFEDED